MEKQFIATQKYLLMSPRKIRLVTALVKKMKPAEAVEKLPFVQKRAAIEVSKVIKNAIAAAKFAGVSETDLVIKEIQVNEGPRLKRGRAASRGMWHPFKKRMAHIRVVLATNAKPEVLDSKQIEKKEDEGAKEEIKKVEKKRKEAKS
ncbi:MAG: 50S ribosomal protein L22 [uncultured bacterium]|nr:MAG: 50S ribosomal protein L22 [uncultured bacterium]